MFGYIKINKMDMTFREHEIYKSMYCGICKHIKREYGEVARFTINYDITFLELLLSSVYNVEEEVFSEACIANPIQKKRHMINVFTEYASAMNIILAYYNIEDDVEDDNRVRDLLARLAFKSAFKKAKKKHNAKAEYIEGKLRELKELEEKKISSTDILSNIFGEILREVFDFDVSVVELIEPQEHRKDFFYYPSFYVEANGDSVYGSNGDKEQYLDYYQDKKQIGNEYKDGYKDKYNNKILDEKIAQNFDLDSKRQFISDMGFNLGKYIYILDAFEDMKKDAQKGSFNPFNIGLNINSYDDYKNFLKSGDVDGFIQSVDRKLAMIMSRVSISLDNLKISNNLGIIENIIYSGVCMNFGRLVLKMKEVEDEQ